MNDLRDLKQYGLLSRKTSPDQNFQFALYTISFTQRGSIKLSLGESEELFRFLFFNHKFFDGQ